MDDFAGKVAVITGGASGIGLATAKQLAGEGMNIVLGDIQQLALDRAVPEVAALGVRVLGVQCDVAKLESVQALADRAFDEMGKVHLLFNNAGVAVFGPMQEMSHQDWEWLVNVNLWGVIHGVEAFLPQMIAQGEGGHVVNTASFAGLVANSGLGVYCVTKYAVVGLSECLFRDVSNEGIGVSVLCPMQVTTNIYDSARNRPAELGGPTEATAQRDDSATASISAEAVAGMVVDGVKKGELYIFTHPQSRGPIRRRFERIDRSFES